MSRYHIPSTADQLTRSPEFFYRTHDPTTVNRQGGDTGTRVSFFHSYHGLAYHSRKPAEYRSAIFANTPEQEAIAQRVTEEVQAKHFTPKGKKIVTTVETAKEWWDAEDYHQLYLFKNPNGYQCPTHRLHW